MEDIRLAHRRNAKPERRSSLNLRRTMKTLTPWPVLLMSQRTRILSNFTTLTTISLTMMIFLLVECRVKMKKWVLICSLGTLISTLSKLCRILRTQRNSPAQTGRPPSYVSGQSKRLSASLANSKSCQRIKSSSSLARKKARVPRGFAPSQLLKIVMKIHPLRLKR